MLLTFYVRSKPHGSPADEDETYLEKRYRQLASLSELSWDEIIAWAKISLESGQQKAKVLFLYLSGQPDPTSTPKSEATAGSGSVRTTDIGKPTPEAEKGGLWSFAGLFSGLKGKNSTSRGAADSDLWNEKWDEGEVHAHLVKVSQSIYHTEISPGTDFHRISKVVISSGSTSISTFPVSDILHSKNVD